MPNNEEGNYFKIFKSKEIKIPKNPFSTGKEDIENKKEDNLSQDAEQFFGKSPQRNLAPIKRMLPEEAGSIPAEGDSREAEKMKEYREMEKEFQKKIAKLKKEDKTLEIDFHDGVTGKEFIVSSGGARICTGAISKDGMLIISKKAGPQEDHFFHNEKDKFFRKFEDLCSK